MPLNTESRTLPTLALLLAALCLCAGLGIREPWPPDEPRYILVAQEMVASGNWFLPTRGGELYPDKPPVFMWAEAAVYRLTGSTRVSFLLPSLLAGLGTLWLTYACGRALWDRRIGMISAMLLFFTFQFLKQTTDGQIDALLCFWTTLGATGFLRHYLRGPAPGWFVAAMLACGLGVLTKGVGFLPMLLIPIAMLYRRVGAAPGRVTAHLSTGWKAASLAAFLLPLAAWVVPMLLLSLDDPGIAAYRDNILLQQTVERYVEPSGHLNPAWFYVVRVIPLNWMTLSPLMLFAIPWWWREARDEPRFWLPLLWIVLVVLFFSLTKGKRDIYVYPAVPIAALVVAPLFETLLKRRVLQWLYVAIAVGFTALLMAALAVALGWFEIGEEPSFPLSGLAPILAWCILASVASGAVFRRRHSYLWLSVLLLAAWLAFRLLATPLLNDSRSSRGLLQQVALRIGPAAELGLAGWREQTLLQARTVRPGEPALFGLRAPDPTQWNAAFDWLRGGSNRWLLFPDETAPECLDLERAEDMGRYHDTHWLLVNSDALEPGCRAGD
jgi:4-amino-4-deoxy-L-arabinose transferase-like glycosyltransferase